MKSTTIDYAKFQLPFLKTSVADDEAGKGSDVDEDSPSRNEQFDAMEELIPREAIFIGRVQDEVENWTSWESDDHFYLLPWNGDDYQWALFRISWDDNWGSYDWDAIARIRGVTDSKEAARKMFKGWMTKCGMTGPDYKPYRSLINGFR